MKCYIFSVTIQPQHHTASKLDCQALNTYKLFYFNTLWSRTSLKLKSSMISWLKTGNYAGKSSRYLTRLDQSFITTPIFPENKKKFHNWGKNFATALMGPMTTTFTWSLQLPTFLEVIISFFWFFSTWGLTTATISTPVCQKSNKPLQTNRTALHFSTILAPS